MESDLNKSLKAVMAQLALGDECCRRGTKSTKLPRQKLPPVPGVTRGKLVRERKVETDAGVDHEATGNLRFAPSTRRSAGEFCRAARDTT